MNARTHYGKGVKLGQTIRCAETGKLFTAAADGCTFNYAQDARGRLFSDEGVDIRERRQLQDRSKPFCAYISGDAQSVTGWKGNVLGTITEKHTIECPRRSWVHGSHMLAIRVRDVHGREWWGRGSPGFAITLRACGEVRP